MTYESILISGGTGSFGNAFARYALDHGLTERLVIFSRDELKQSEMRTRFGNDPRLRFFLGDVRDVQRLRRALDGVEAVIHAAALKQVDAIEYNPSEAVKTNVGGAHNLIEAATEAGVSKVVALSTDKACNPVNAYGASKLMAEKLILSANNARGATGPRFASTRYGNVAGSRGSVIPVWREAIRRGETCRITDPEHTRFYMELREAVDLVAWTLEKMIGGELVVPNLPAYRLGDLAEAMGVTPEVVGVRPGEKMAESMIGPDEVDGFSAPCPYFVRGGLWRDAPRKLTAPVTSDTAPRLTVEELRERLRGVT